jgi:hypothetical protein
MAQDPNNVFSSASIAAVLADVVIADRHTPPHNGKEALERVEHALNGLGLYDFTAAEFCQPAATQDTSRVAQLRAKQAKQALDASNALAAAASAHPAPSTPGRSVKVEGKVGVSADVQLDEESTTILSTMVAHPAPPPSSSASAHYAPPTMTSTTNSLADYSATSTVRYLDPLTDKLESQALVGQRSLAQRLLEKVFMPHHSHVVVSCRHGDISGIWALARALCVGDATSSKLDAITAMVNMVRVPPQSWPALSHMATQLQLSLHRDSTGDNRLLVGLGLLPEFVMRALQSPNFDYLRVDVALLHKVAGHITIERIQHDMSAAHSLVMSRPGGRALHAQAPPAPVPDPPPDVASALAASGVPVCFQFRDKGSCRFGDKCRYTHGNSGPAKGSGTAKDPSLTGVCASCSSPSHGINQCPVRLQRRKEGNEKANKARAEGKAQMAKLTEDMATMRAMMAKPAAPSAPDPAVEIQQLKAQLAASFNPYFAYGPGGVHPPP